MLVDSLVRFALLGSSWVLYLLLALSVVSFAATFERWLFFRKNRVGGEGLRDQLRKAMREDDEAAVRRVLAKNPSIEASVLGEALDFVDGGARAVSDAIESGVGRERAQLERSMTLLGTLGNNAPFVGLFGTVLGVIEAFAHLGGGDQSAMGSVMSGIAEALVATGVGIFVAIPAVVAFNVAQKKIGDIENDVTALGKLLTAWIETRERGRRVRDAAAPDVVKSESKKAEASTERKKTEARAASSERELVAEGAE
ncbi:MAG: MotA/TolQ/ExbB proton channel family protein [Deltaproteobacteria bacterium]|nr:MotA/TolQ/ExbB proton channel family protein [Deltaproteobacteria bacterium]